MAAEWFYTVNRRQMGPVSWPELCALAESGSLKPSDMVWSEGMADWIKASKQAGLFAETEPAPTAIGVVETARAEGTHLFDDVDADHEILRRRTRRVDREQGGSGVKIGLIVTGGLGLALLLGVGIGALIWVANTMGGQRHEYTIHNLQPAASNVRPFEFRKGQRVIITVDSTVTDPNTDVDLFVVRGPAGHDVIAIDDGPEKDCRVDFVVPTTGSYRVIVENLGPGMARTCQVTVIER